MLEISTDIIYKFIGKCIEWMFEKKKKKKKKKRKKPISEVGNEENLNEAMLKSL